MSYHGPDPSSLLRCMERLQGLCMPVYLDSHEYYRFYVRIPDAIECAERALRSAPLDLQLRLGHILFRARECSEKIVYEMCTVDTAPGDTFLHQPLFATYHAIVNAKDDPRLMFDLKLHDRREVQLPESAFDPLVLQLPTEKEQPAQKVLPEPADEIEGPHKQNRHSALLPGQPIPHEVAAILDALDLPHDAMKPGHWFHRFGIMSDALRQAKRKKQIHAEPGAKGNLYSVASVIYRNLRRFSGVKGVIHVKNAQNAQDAPSRIRAECGNEQHTDPRT